MSSTDGSAAVDAKDTAPITDTLNRQKSTTNPNDPDRFKYGVLIRGKFIGVEDVKEDHGDELCKNSMIKLKAIVLAKKEHKQRICIKITLDGVEILDERTNQPIFNHSVNKISYIARDVSDPRAIGYIYKNGKESFQYFAIKTLGQAQELFNTLKELFEVVLEMRNKEKQNAAAGHVTKETKSAEEPAAAAANDPEISTLQDKIKQMNEQPEPSLFDLGGGNEALTSIEDTPQSPTPAAAAAEPAKKPSNELFDLFDSPPDSSANNKPPVDPKYAMLANEISTLNSQLSSTPPRSAPIPPMPGYGAAQNPFPMQQQQPAFNMGMQQPAYNNPMQMPMQANNPFNFGAMPAQPQQQQQFPNPMMGGMRMNTPMTQPAQNGAFMTPQLPQFQPQQQQQFNNNPLW